MYPIRRITAVVGLAVALVFGSVGSPAAYATAPAVASNPAQASVVITKHPGSVRRGATASVFIRTAPKANCSIAVYYKSGASRAQGLFPQAANARGNITRWWKVGTRTTPGSWPVVISCGKQGSARTVVTVP
jgi:hypothetical protein